MNEHNEQTSTQTSPVPSPITLEDFVEAVTRGVTRALETQDDTGGYALRTPMGTAGAGPSIGGRPIVINLGIWAPPPPDGMGLPGMGGSMSGGSRQ